jgi:ATPases involved in chromosome partitioning
MTRYLLVTRSAEYEARLQRALRPHLQSVPGEYLTLGAKEIVDRIEGHPRVALLGPLLNFAETLELAQAIRERHPGIGVIVVREQRADLEDWVDGIQMQAVLSPEASDQATEELLSRLGEWLVASGRLSSEPEIGDDVEADAAEADPIAFLIPGFDELIDGASDTEDEPPEETEDWVLPPLGDGARAEVIVVAAPKGGQGKTTMAVNLSAGLAEVEPNSVVLLDADLQFGDVANALELRPQHSLVELAQEVDEIAIKTLLSHHADGFFVVAAPPSPEAADSVSPPALGALIDRLSAMFRYVVIDTSPGLGEHTLAALEHATDGVFVTNVTVPSLRALRTEFEMLVALGLVPPNRHVVLNFVEKNTGLLTKDAEAIVGARVDVEVRRSPAVVLASNAGVPFIHHDPRDPAAKAIRSLLLRVDQRAVQHRGRARRKEKVQ